MNFLDLRKRLGLAEPDSMAGFSKKLIYCKWEELLKKLD
jgi:hypothetical protein